MAKTDRLPQPQASIHQLTQELFSHLSFSSAHISVALTSAAEGDTFNLKVQVKPETSGLLIGYHGETISHLQLLLSLLVYKQLGQWHRLLLNINDYREKRHHSLTEMALTAATRAKTTSQEVVLPPMVSFDRRLIHLALASDQQVETKSIGQGRDRRLVVYPKTSSPPSPK